MSVLRSLLAASLISAIAINSFAEGDKPLMQEGKLMPGKAGLEIPRRSTSVKLNLYSLVSSFAPDISVQHTFKNNMAFQLAVFYRYKSEGSDVSNTVNIIPEYRYYVDDDRTAPSGFYIAPYLQYNYMVNTSRYKINTNYNTEKYVLYGLGVATGYQLVRSSGLTFDVFMGASRLGGKSTFSDSGLSGTPEQKSNRAFIGYFRWGLSAGYSF
ncbi:MAG: DUF3575 domain-containing protein [Bacteroidota bacterium]